METQTTPMAERQRLTIDEAIRISKIIATAPAAGGGNRKEAPCAKT